MRPGVSCFKHMAQTYTYYGSPPGTVTVARATTLSPLELIPLRPVVFGRIECGCSRPLPFAWGEVSTYSRHLAYAILECECWAGFDPYDTKSYSLFQWWMRNPFTERVIKNLPRHKRWVLQSAQIRQAVMEIKSAMEADPAEAYACNSMRSD